MRILHISDLHFGGEDRAAIAAVGRFVDAHAPDLIVVSGDLSVIGTQDQLDAAFDWLALLGAPVVATPGNHDVPYHEVFPRLYRPFRRYERAADAAKVFAAWNAQNVRIITINTARGWQLRLNWALGAVSRSQLKRARHALRETPKHMLRIVVTHHPLMFPTDSPLPGQTHKGRLAAHALAEAGAQIFLAGHLHTTVESRIAGQALSLCAGTLSLRLREELPGFLLLDWDGGHTLILERWVIADGEANRTSADSLTLA